MKYVKCPRCNLNYIPVGADICPVCRDELNLKKSIFDEVDYDELLCPYCECNTMGVDEIMCAECRARRNRVKK